MTSLYEDDNPWLVVRSDAEMLEDGYQKMLEDARGSEVEARVLSEQKVIERKARKALRQFEEQESFGDEEAGFEIDEDDMEEADESSLRAILKDSVCGSRLYREAIMWAKETVAWAREAYPSAQDPEGRLYAVALHASVVPTKVRFAQDEEEMEDVYATELAGLEYRLARDYLKATLRSLRMLSPAFPEAQWFYAQGCLLNEQLLQVERKNETSRSFRLRHL